MGLTALVGGRGRESIVFQGLLVRALALAGRGRAHLQLGRRSGGLLEGEHGPRRDTDGLEIVLAARDLEHRVERRRVSGLDGQGSAEPSTCLVEVAALEREQPELARGKQQTTIVRAQQLASPPPVRRGPLDVPGVVSDASELEAGVDVIG